MEINEILTLITNAGFPIACCVVMFKQNGEMQKTLNEMTLSLQKLTDRIENHLKEDIENG